MSGAQPRALATVPDLAGWLGETITEDSADWQAAGWALAYATTLALTYTGRAADVWDAGSVPDAVRHVVLACAARGFTNPEGWTYERVDDWGAGGKKVTEEGLYLTTTEKALLDTYKVSRRSGIGTIGTSREVATSHSPATVDYLLGRW